MVAVTKARCCWCSQVRWRIECHRRQQPIFALRSTTAIRSWLATRAAPEPHPLPVRMPSTLPPSLAGRTSLARTRTERACPHSWCLLSGDRKQWSRVHRRAASAASAAASVQCRSGSMPVIAALETRVPRSEFAAGSPRTFGSGSPHCRARAERVETQRRNAHCNGHGLATADSQLRSARTSGRRIAISRILARQCGAIYLVQVKPTGQHRRGSAAERYSPAQPFDALATTNLRDRLRPRATPRLPLTRCS